MPHLISPSFTNGHSHVAPAKSLKPLLPLDGFGTRAIHVGSEPDPATGAVIPPLTLSTTFKQDAVGVHKGYEYGRSGNPNREALESLLASLESGGAHALTFASGSATTATILQSLGPSSHVLSVSDVYGGTRRYMTQVAGAWGLEVTYLDMEGAGENVIRDAIRPNTKLIWVESPTNPTLRLMDIPLLAQIAHTHPSSPYLLVDNTFLSPFYSSPLLQGADVVIHSLTKYINGHSDVIMGCAILPAHNSALHAKLRFLQNAIGAVPSPHDCYLAQRGAKTLAMRMKTHGRNALRVARALEASPYVQEVIYPGLKGHRAHGLAYRSLAPHAKRWVDAFVGERNISRGDNWEDDGEGLDGLHDTPHLNGTYTPESEEEDDNDDNSIGDFPYGGMISVRLKPFPPSHSLPHSPTTPSPSPPPAQSPALALLPILRLFTLAESLGGVESLAELPSAMTHAGVPESERALLGIDDNLIRLSVGCEEGQDLVEDLVGALGRVYAGVAV